MDRVRNPAVLSVHTPSSKPFRIRKRNTEATSVAGVMIRASDIEAKGGNVLYVEPGFIFLRR
jgi:hypothetical protein